MENDPLPVKHPIGQSYLSPLCQNESSCETILPVKICFPHMSIFKQMKRRLLLKQRLKVSQKWLFTIQVGSIENLAYRAFRSNGRLCKWFRLSVQLHMGPQVQRVCIGIGFEWTTQWKIKISEPQKLMKLLEKIIPVLGCFPLGGRVSVFMMQDHSKQSKIKVTLESTLGMDGSVIWFFDYSCDLGS